MTVVIVTGASSGIGEAIARRLGRPGMTVVLAARREAELTRLASEIEGNGGAAVVAPTDVRDPKAVIALIQRAREVNGRIDALVNNAGVGGPGSILADDEIVDEVIDVNLRAPIRLMRTIVPVMREQGGGTIVNIGSVAGEVGISGIYSATKFALRGMTDSVRRELMGTGVNVVLVEPGYIGTPANNRNRKNLPGPEIVAAAVDSAIKRPRRRIIVPGKYRAAVLAANALPMVADRIYAGKASKRGSLGHRSESGQ